jgi:hypothetical protein
MKTPGEEERETMAQNQNHTTARFNGVKVFSATMAQERENLGEKVTAWIREHPQFQVVDTIVTQSSDELSLSGDHALLLGRPPRQVARRSRLQAPARSRGSEPEPLARSPH